jgi:phosphoribosyl 1,2-cyclic phosphate phosphodiesterase
LIYKKDLRSFKNLDYLVVDCLWYKKHISHYNLDDVLNLVKIIKPKKVILTNMHNVLDYDKIKKNLPPNIVPGYDGMTVNL